jgi:hypothetical protein
MKGALKSLGNLDENEESDIKTEEIFDTSNN